MDKRALAIAYATKRRMQGASAPEVEDLADEPNELLGSESDELPPESDLFEAEPAPEAPQSRKGILDRIMQGLRKRPSSGL